SSFPDQVIVLRFVANKAGALTFRAALSSPHPTAKCRAEGSDSIVMTGQAPGFALRRTLEWVEQRGEQWKYPELWDKEGHRRPHAKPVLYGEEIGGLGMLFEARMHASVKGGELASGDSGLRVRNASEVLLVVTPATSFAGPGKSPSREGSK